MPVFSFHYFIYREIPLTRVSGLSWTVSVFHKNQDNPENYLTVLFLESFIFSSNLFITEVLACIVKAIQELLRQMRNCAVFYTYIYIHTYVCVCVCVHVYLFIGSFPGGSDSKEFAWSAGDRRPVQEIWVKRIHWRKK